MSDTNPITENKTLSCVFKDEETLYLAYMPFLIGGGLFVRTKNSYPLGVMVSLSIQLFTEPSPFLIDAKVVWITPKSAQGNKPVGVGVQFQGENSRNVSNKIETYLAGMLKSTQLTDTI
jgi:type IV pilus assembly protein PilZ